MSGANEVLLVPLSRRKTPPSGHPLGYPKHLRQQKKLRNADSMEARRPSRLFSTHLERGGKSALEASPLRPRGSRSPPLSLGWLREGGGPALLRPRPGSLQRLAPRFQTPERARPGTG